VSEFQVTVDGRLDVPGLPSDGAAGARPDDQSPAHWAAGADGGHRRDDPDPEPGADGGYRYDDLDPDPELGADGGYRDDDLDPGEDGYDPDPADVDLDEDAEQASWLAASRLMCGPNMRRGRGPGTASRCRPGSCTATRAAAGLVSRPAVRWTPCRRDRCSPR
jgi:hypothetical protein